MSVAARFVRQILLPQIGEAGQARLGQANAETQGPGFALDIAERYAAAAGFGEIVPREDPVDLETLAPVDILETPEARELLAGARIALSEIRRVIAPR